VTMVSGSSSNLVRLGAWLPFVISTSPLSDAGEGPSLDTACDVVSLPFVASFMSPLACLFFLFLSFLGLGGAALLCPVFWPSSKTSKRSSMMGGFYSQRMMAKLFIEARKAKVVTSTETATFRNLGSRTLKSSCRPTVPSRVVQASECFRVKDLQTCECRQLQPAAIHNHLLLSRLQRYGHFSKKVICDRTDSSDERPSSSPRQNGIPTACPPRLPLLETTVRQPFPLPRGPSKQFAIQHTDKILRTALLVIHG
jgi:hypothetical protein